MTPSERRIAEMAYAYDGLSHACQRVWALRGEPHVPSVTTNAEMLAELRREPYRAVSVGYTDPLDSALMHAKALADERDRYRWLLERIIDAHDGTTSQLDAAINDARKELG